MKNRKDCVLAHVCAVVLLPFGAGAYDHESLTTEQGRVYHEIFVIEADAHGLTFRHRDGVAKLGFESLSPAYRMLYETMEDLPATEPVREEEDGIGPDGGDPGAPGAFAGDWLDFVEDEPILLHVGSRIAIRRPLPCQPVVPWYSWWPRQYGQHPLAHPLGRERAVREFLLLSGLTRGARMYCP